jgi:nitrogen regulatory protein P-II 1
MMNIQAIMRAGATLTIKDELAKLGVTRWRSWEVHEFGSGEGRHTSYRGQEFTEQFLRKTAVEVLVSDEQADSVVDALVAAARASGGGDAEIVAVPVARAVRIVNGQVDEMAAEPSAPHAVARRVA